MTARNEYLALVIKWNRHVNLFNSATRRHSVGRPRGADNGSQLAHPGEKWEERARSSRPRSSVSLRAISDLIADLLHLARRDYYSLSRCLELAEHGIGMFIAENRTRDGEPMANDRPTSSSERPLCAWRDIADRRGGGKTAMRLIEHRGFGHIVKKSTASRS